MLKFSSIYTYLPVTWPKWRYLHAKLARPVHMRLDTWRADSTWKLECFYGFSNGGVQKFWPLYVPLLFCFTGSYRPPPTPMRGQLYLSRLQCRRQANLKRDSTIVTPCRIPCFVYSPTIPIGTVLFRLTANGWYLCTVLRRQEDEKLDTNRHTYIAYTKHLPV